MGALPGLVQSSWAESGFRVSFDRRSQGGEGLEEAAKRLAGEGAPDPSGPPFLGVGGSHTHSVWEASISFSITWKVKRGVNVERASLPPVQCSKISVEVLGSLGWWWWWWGDSSLERKRGMEGRMVGVSSLRIRPVLEEKAEGFLLWDRSELVGRAGRQSHRPLPLSFQLLPPLHLPSPCCLGL